MGNKHSGFNIRLKEWVNCVTVIAEFAAATLLIVLNSHVPA
jgi:hypothetical protein